MGAIEETLKSLEEASRKHDKVLVGYSDGKDSRVVLDLCVRSFRHVEAFFMYLVPGLRCVEDGLRWAEDRWGVPIHRIPHWVGAKYLRNAVYCDPKMSLDDVPEWKLADCYAAVSAKTGIPIIATGAKRTDSAWRRRAMGNWQAEMFTPIKTWNKMHVVGYLKTRGIPLPDSSDRNATGVDLSTPSLLWLHDQYPDDFETLARTFPYIRAVVARRHFYGVE